MNHYTLHGEKSNDFSRERIWQDGANYYLEVELVNLSGPLFNTTSEHYLKPLSKEQVKEWQAHPDWLIFNREREGEFGTARMRSSDGKKGILCITGDRDHDFIINAFPPLSDYLTFAESNIDDRKVLILGWLTREQAIERAFQKDLGWRYAHAVRIEQTNSILEFPYFVKPIEE